MIDRQSDQVLQKILSEYEDLGGITRNVKTGRIVGNFHKINKRVQVSLRIESQTFTFWRAHIIWVLNQKAWPIHTIDHIDRNRLNDRIENLRDIPMTDNWSHSRIVNNNMPRNVYPKGNGFQVIVNGVYCGMFQCIETAIVAARMEREEKGLV